MSKGWELPPGMPPQKTVEAAAAKLRAVIEARGLTPGVDPVKTNYQVAGLVTALMQRGIVSGEEVDYYAAVVELESLRVKEIETRPKPRIIVPGREGPLS
ncbi:MAG: hypothetical protein KGJ98_11735 [Chloroflexota bacterium]|nr:hypothetical protein [Chloroflexota bacterium]